MHFGAIAKSVVGHGLEFDKNSILAYPDLALLLVIFLISYPACQVTEHHLYSHKEQENNNSSQTCHLYITSVIVYLIPAKHVISTFQQNISSLHYSCCYPWERAHIM